MTDQSNPDRLLNLEAGRRAFLRNAGLVAAASALGTTMASTVARAAAPLTDADILNFALNLEYLEAEYYLMGAFGSGLSESEITGRGGVGNVIGGRKVDFKTAYLREFFTEIADDEHAHVDYLRKALGSAKVARPTIDLKNSFTAAAVAAGLIEQGQTFDPFADEDSFLLGAFIFEDVGVTAYKGAAPLIEDRGYLSAAAGILAVEAYHAAEIRTNLYRAGLFGESAKISNLRDKADGRRSLDQPIRRGDEANIVPANTNGIAFGRTPEEVLGIVYLGGERKGGFFPNGANGTIR
jgi:hypothetical protein